jgi:hypothetical protein
MTSIFTLEGENDEIIDKIDINELYEKKKSHDLRELKLYQKILNRIYIKIKMTSKIKMNEQFIWFLVPEMVIGYSKYDVSNCILFLIDKLQDNGFKTKYYHPNLLFICWSHYIPSYVRDEIKNKLGIRINEYGNKIEDNKQDYAEENDEIIFNNKRDKQMNLKIKMGGTSTKLNEKYNDTKSYNPSGILSFSKLQK